MYFDMFSSGVKHGVASEVDVAHIVAEDANRIRKGNAQVLQDALKPYDFAGGDDRASIFGFCCSTMRLSVASYCSRRSLYYRGRR